MLFTRLSQAGSNKYGESVGLLLLLHNGLLISEAAFSLFLAFSCFDSDLSYPSCACPSLTILTTRPRAAMFAKLLAMQRGLSSSSAAPVPPPPPAAPPPPAISVLPLLPHQATQSGVRGEYATAASWNGSVAGAPSGKPSVRGVPTFALVQEVSCHLPPSPLMFLMHLHFSVDWSLSIHRALIMLASFFAFSPNSLPFRRLPRSLPHSHRPSTSHPI
jgi:hypothetical protein